MLVTVDTGGTKTLVASFSEDGVLGAQIKFPTPKVPADYIKLLRDTLVEQYAGQAVEAVVIGMPGTVRDGVAVWCQNLGWKNFDVASSLVGVLGDAPILVENDANLAGLAETRSLHTTPALSLYVTLSTGIGTGIITDGTINKSLRFSEGGRALVEFDGVVREWEDFSSGKAIYNAYGKYARDITSKRTWNEIADRISRGFLALIPTLQPDVIIIGGSLGTYFGQYADQLVAILKEKLPDHIALPKIIHATHPEQAVIYGCYYYALDSFTHSTS
jgi:glucokinase